MNFLIDAHLPRRLVFHLRERGHDAIHTLDLPQANNQDLERHFLANLGSLVDALATHDYVELSRSAVILHG